MANVNSILNQRMKKASNISKMAAMAQQSATGQLTSFSGVFHVVELSVKEKEILQNILQNYAREDQSIRADLDVLISLTSEVKAINNQAALLHGERIKKAHQLLKGYREGAFTTWLVTTYGNRQTPYNLMQYYEFYETLPKKLRPQLELMPRQAIYVLASRDGNMEEKQAIVENYKGETKTEILTLIRQAFPLDQEDKRQQKMGNWLVQALQKLCHQLKQTPKSLTPVQKNQAQLLLQQLQQLLEIS